MQILLSSILLLFTLQMGGCKTDAGSPLPYTPEIQTPVDGIAIAWDYRSLKKIAPLDDRSGYFGYARMIQLFDGSLACVYETSTGNVELVSSTDLGNSWTGKQTIFETKNNIAMAVPEIIELSDHSIIVACNPRPRPPYTDDRKFAIKVRKSTDNGKAWGNEQVIYQAQSTFENGCWEPSLIQLPDGQVQLFFSDEGIYTSSGEQNISMLQSSDFGNTWTSTPRIIGFRKDRRDGMPVPMLLKEKGELLIAIEDNKKDQFKPSIYREKLSENWSDGTITADDQRREYAPQVQPLDENIYAGAPYLKRLQTGQVLLSYQTTWQRSSIWDQSAMAVEIGNESAHRFDRRSVPFNVPLGKHGLWNSLSVINGTIPVALTSTNAYSNTSTEVWMIKGKVIPEFSIPRGTPVIDGILKDDCWKHEWPYLVGQTSPAQLISTICKDDQFLFVGVKVDGLSPASGNNPSGLFTFFIDTERKGYKAPETGVFAFKVQTDGTTTIEQGQNGKWVANHSDKTIQAKQTSIENGQTIEIAIPLDLFPKDFGKNKSVGINVSLRASVNESITSVEKDQPFTWIRAFLPD